MTLAAHDALYLALEAAAKDETPSIYSNTMRTLTKRQLDNILANPDHRRALLAVLLPVQRAFLADALWDEAVETPSGRTPKSGTLPGAYLELADRLLRRLTEPTDTGSGSDD